MEKVIHILPRDGLSGAEKMALLICKNMYDYEPIVVCGGKKLASIFAENNIQSIELNFSLMSSLDTIIKLIKFIKTQQIKIIHAHDNYASLLSLIIKNVLKEEIKIISHMHSCYPWLTIESKRKKLDKLLRPQYDFNIACGKTVYDFCIGNTDYFPIEKTTILANAIDLREIEKNQTNYETIYNKFDIPRNKIVIGYVGRICEIKGIIPFILEFNEHKNRFTDCIFLIVGSGEQYKEVISLIEDLDLKQYFILTGYQTDVYSIYPLIDIFFLPSLYEGLPMVLLEAMAFKTPIVSMNVGGIKEVVLNNKNGFLIEEKKYGQMIESIHLLKECTNKRKNMGNISYDIVKGEYTIESYIHKLTRIYNGLLDEKENKIATL